MTTTTKTTKGGREQERVKEIRDDMSGWRRWGPYLTDRAWGSVREDYSADGNAWCYLTYDKARAKAYRWGEDGIAGVSDRYQLLNLAMAFWNERDPHLKERFFGVNPYEGNHGEDPKDYWFHVDNTPTHSYMKLLYKYPQRAFPYQHLIEENQRRQGQGPEYELVDTGIFDEDRYFDIEIEYAKASPEDLCVRITVHNRGPEAAPLHVLPHLWFRNTWAWGAVSTAAPRIEPGRDDTGGVCLVADDTDVCADPFIPVQYRIGVRYLFGPRGGHELFTDNETNAEVAFGPGTVSRSAYTKEAFHRYLVDNVKDAIRPERFGSKAALHYRIVVPAHGTQVLHFRLTDVPSRDPLCDIDALVNQRKLEADEFYESVAPPGATPDEKHVQRRALAGLLWTKQGYIFDVAKWLDGDNPEMPPPQSRKRIRNQHWRHLNSMRIMTMPDKWEYPWFAAWDLAFQCVPFALIDPMFAKDQLQLLLFEQFQHPNGQIPAYEWEFGDLNPPVHAWAVWRVYNMDRIRSGTADRPWLERCFHKLLINFANWVNKVDREGNNLFEGGFLGLDNITVVDRSEKAKDGSTLEQSDATGWMGMFCLGLMRIALELARENPIYEGLATKFLQHYTYVAFAMKHMGNRDYSLFDQVDGFFYDVLRYPDGSYKKFRVRSLVGLIPLFAVERLEKEWLEPFKEFRANLNWFLKNRREMVEEVIHTIELEGKATYLLTIVNQNQLQRMLERMHNETEFLSRYGIRSLSKYHEAHPFHMDGSSVTYEPAESAEKLKGGNSNWRGPLWFPTSFLIIESLRKLGTAFGPRYTLRTPGSHDEPINFWDMAHDIARRMIDIFLVNENGVRPVWGGNRKFRTDPYWKDEVLFYEYFHGDNGAGIGASHQTGWTALVANLIDEWRRLPTRR
ncbi:MAG TPA: glucosidase [Pseudomonadota bacterium]|nr:glucosidase [Pseudomonadota bacterium]